MPPITLNDILTKYNETVRNSNTEILLDKLPDEIIQFIITFLIPDYIFVTRQSNWWKKYFHTEDIADKSELSPSCETILTLLSFSSVLKGRFRVDLNHFWHGMFNGAFKISSLINTKVTPDSADMDCNGDWEEYMCDGNVFGRYYVAKEIGYLHDLEKLNENTNVHIVSELPIEMTDLGDQNDVDEYMKHQMELLETEFDESEDYLIRFTIEMFKILRSLCDARNVYFTGTEMVETVSDKPLDMSGKSLEVYFSLAVTELASFWNEWNSKWFDQLQNYLFIKLQIRNIPPEFQSKPILFPDSIIDATIHIFENRTLPNFVFPNVRNLTVHSDSLNLSNIVTHVKFPKLKSLNLVIPIETKLNTIGHLPLDSISVEYHFYECYDEGGSFTDLKPKYLLSFHYALNPKREMDQLPNLYTYGINNNIRTSLNESAVNKFYSLTYE